MIKLYIEVLIDFELAILLSLPASTPDISISKYPIKHLKKPD